MYHYEGYLFCVHTNIVCSRSCIMSEKHVVNTCLLIGGGVYCSSSSSNSSECIVVGVLVLWSNENDLSEVCVHTAV